MSKIDKAIAIGVTIAKKVSDDENVQKLVFGSYSDGKPRNLTDALNDEYYSPKQKSKHHKKKKKSKKKKKKDRIKL